MGSRHIASCPCGYSTSVPVGGTMSTFATYSSFPYYCKNCGLVNVNVADEKIFCPKCKSEDIDQYGLDKVSDLKVKQTYPWPCLENIDRTASRDGHLCPDCKNFTLSFKPPTMLVD